MDGLDKLQQGYQKDIDALRAASDATFHIFSQRVKTFNGHTWVRDATQALALGDPDRPPHDDLAIDGNNTLLRMLTRLRAIDYMLSKQLPLNSQQQARDEIKEQFEVYKKSILRRSNPLFSDKKTHELARNVIKTAEEGLSTFLIKKLHEANLTKGCSTKKDAEALLAHYKVLYSVLDPAMPLVTLTYDKKTRILQRETQYPVTEKTELQKMHAGVLKTVIPHPLNGEINAHTVHNEAKQQADACFANLIVADDRMLTSQARKTHLVGVKNAFIVKVETQKLPKNTKVESIEDPLGDMDDDEPLWLGRMAVPVYVGKGEKYTNEHVKANLEQLHMAAKKHMKHDGTLKIHLTTLNTYTNIDGEKQDVMIDGLRKGMKGTKSEVSVVPTNDVGMLYTPQLATSIERKGKVQAGKKADRLDLAVDVTLEAHEQENTLSFVNCAGGADRTGTVIEEVIQRHTVEKMKQMCVDKSDVAAMRARGFNSAEIAHQAVPGTPGMKPCSQANNWFGWGRKTFSDLVAREFYLETADLNKKNKVKNVYFLKVPGDAVLQEYKDSKEVFEKALNPIDKTSLCSELKDAGKKILIKAQDTSNFKAQDYINLSKIYKLATHVIQNLSLKLDEANLKTIALNLKRIDNMQRVFSGQETMAKRIRSFVIATVVSVAAIILLTVPWFHTIFVVTGLVIAISSVKLGASLGLWQKLAWRVMSAATASMNEKPKYGVVEATLEFSKAGHAFFKTEVKKLGTGKEEAELQDKVKGKDEESKDKGPEPDATF